MTPSTHHISEGSRRQFLKHKRKLDILDEGCKNHKMRRTSSCTPATCSSIQVRTCGCTHAKCLYLWYHMAPSAQVVSHVVWFQVNGTSDDNLQDTVGAICVDDQGNITSAVSSGGIVLKQPGRLGQVSVGHGQPSHCCSTAKHPVSLSISYVAFSRWLTRPVICHGPADSRPCQHPA